MTGTVVIGAGQAGLAISWHLTRALVTHDVLEARDRFGGSWLYTMGSSLIMGVGADAAHLADRIA